MNGYFDVISTLSGDTAGRFKDAIGCDVGVNLEEVEFSAARGFIGELALGYG